MPVVTRKAGVSAPLDRFPLAPSVATPRIIWTGWGDIGAGKTRFALTGPAPLVVLSFDRGLEGVVEDFRAEHDKEIRVVTYDWEPTDEEEQTFTKEQAIELRDQFISDYKFACQHARTVVVDTECAMWNLFRYAEFGAPKADVPRDFDKANQMMRKYVSLPKKLTINAGFLQTIRDEWASQSKKSGAVKRAGFGETPKIIQTDLWHERNDGKFSVTVGKSRGPGAKAVQDQTYENLDFATLGMMLFPDTEMDSWT